MQIKTTRCTLRRFEPGDLDDFMAYRNDESWMRFQGGFKGLTRQQYAAALLKPPSLTSGAQLAIVDNERRRVVGDVYLKQQGETYWVGYTVDPRFARRGYGAEAVSALLGWVARRGGALVKAGVAPGNAASIGLLDKLGFRLESAASDELVYVLIINPYK